jgi:exonuclease SbcC
MEISAQRSRREQQLAGLIEDVAELNKRVLRMTLTPTAVETLWPSVGARIRAAAEDRAADAARTAREAAAEAQLAAQRRETTSESLRTAASDLARIDGELTGLGDPDAELAALLAEQAAREQASGDFAVLEKGLGREGLQALEIEVAGPAVSAMANDLLGACYGNRFTLKVVTTARTKDHRTKEVFDIQVIDGDNPNQQKKRGSPGQMAMLDLAVRLSLAEYNVERSGCDLRTLFMDEADSPLTPDNAHAYIQMLRRAQAVGGFDKIYLVSHKPDVIEECDAKLIVGGGTVTIEL